MTTDTHVTAIVERDGKCVAVCSCGRWESQPTTRKSAEAVAWLHRQANREIK